MTELHLRYAIDDRQSQLLGLFVVKNTGNGALAFFSADRAEAEGWAAKWNSGPVTYGDVRDRLLERVGGKGLVESMRDHQEHALDAFRYMMLALETSPPPPRPWHVRQWRAVRWWLSCRLRDLSEWVKP